MDVPDWFREILSRMGALKTVARLSGGEADDRTIFWGDGKYILMHFELVTAVDSQTLNRSKVYAAVRDLVDSQKGISLGGSVNLVPVPNQYSSERFAALFWNSLRAATENILVNGDTFYLHYAPTGINQMGGIGQVVPVRARALNPVITTNA